MLAHPDLAHAGAPNYSSNIRKMLFFRIKVTHTAGGTPSSGTCDKSNSRKKESCRVAKGNDMDRNKSSDISNSSSSDKSSYGDVAGGHKNHPFTDWTEVVQQHAVDMWADLPVLRRELGQRELQHSMQLYVPEYRTFC